MLKFNDNRFVPMAESDLKTQGLLERFNLQEAIVNSWEHFTKEIKIPDLIYIGHEVTPDPRIKGRIDILAFDPNDNIPVVIELKRDRDKLQLLQAISYAAMVSEWESEDFIQLAKSSGHGDDIEEFMNGVEIDRNVRIILIAEKFDPEVIISSDWLLKTYGLDITAISLSVFEKNEELYFSFDQKYPLVELHDTYELRTAKRSLNSSDSNSCSWEDVRETLSYKWGGELLDKCLKEANGDSNRARFIHIRKNIDGLKAISLFFRRKYLNIYILGRLEEPQMVFDKVFKNGYVLSEWRNGYSIHITSHEDYQSLCRWLSF